MESASIFTTKSFWAGVLTPLFTWATVRYGFAVDPELQAAIVGVACAVSAVVLRKVTSRPVHIIPPKE